MAEHAGTVRRREDPRLITGRGEFVDDLRILGCLHAAMVRSPHAHARIRAIDVSAARRAPGVVGVFTAADLGGAGEPMPIYAPHPALPVPCRIRSLATDRARFVGEAVVAVIADSVYRAHDALDLVRVDYEPLPAVVDVEAALAPGAPRLHDELATNVAAEWRQRVGDVEAAFPTADVRVRTRIRLARGGAHPLEPRGLVVRWDDDRLTVWGAVQMVHRHRDVIAGQLGVPRSTSASSRRPTSAAGSAPRGCTTPSTSSSRPWPGHSAGRSSGSRRDASTRWSRAWSATRSTTSRSRRPATGRSSLCATTFCTTWAPTRSPG